MHKYARIHSHVSNDYCMLLTVDGCFVLVCDTSQVLRQTVQRLAKQVRKKKRHSEGKTARWLHFSVPKSAHTHTRAYTHPYAPCKRRLALRGNVSISDFHSTSLCLCVSFRAGKTILSLYAEDCLHKRNKYVLMFYFYIYVYAYLVSYLYVVQQRTLNNFPFFFSHSNEFSFCLFLSVFVSYCF